MIEGQNNIRRLKKKCLLKRKGLHLGLSFRPRSGCKPAGLKVNNARSSHIAILHDLEGGFHLTYYLGVVCFCVSVVKTMRGGVICTR